MKLQDLINEVEAAGVEVRLEPPPPQFRPACAWTNGTISIDPDYIDGTQPEYDENRMIAVIFHELGHLKDFNDNPMTDVARELPTNMEKTEYRAFKNSLEETLKLYRDGQPDPLRSALKFIKKRQEAGNEPDYYQKAIERIVNSDLWASCEEVLNNTS